MAVDVDHHHVRMLLRNAFGDVLDARDDLGNGRRTNALQALVGFVAQLIVLFVVYQLYQRVHGTGFNQKRTVRGTLAHEVVQAEACRLLGLVARDLKLPRDRRYSS